MSTLSDDLIRGTRAIGDELGLPQAAICDLIRTSDVPIFQIGHVNYARKSTLAVWIRSLELKAMMRQPAPPPADVD